MKNHVTEKHDSRDGTVTVHWLSAQLLWWNDGFTSRIYWNAQARGLHLLERLGEGVSQL